MFFQDGMDVIALIDARAKAGELSFRDPIEEIEFKQAAVEAAILAHRVILSDTEIQLEALKSARSILIEQKSSAEAEYNDLVSFERHQINSEVCDGLPF